MSLHIFTPYILNKTSIRAISPLSDVVLFLFFTIDISHAMVSLSLFQNTPISQSSNRLIKLKFVGLIPLTKTTEVISCFNNEVYFEEIIMQ